jgi:thiamine-phosphate pyrophosphorylase
MKLPRLYAIIDASCFSSSDDPVTDMSRYARDLAAAGITLIQYRNKGGNAREMLAQARELRRVLPEGVRLIMNDRADLCLAAGLGGVHVGQEDLSPASVRNIVGPGRWVGVSTHNPDQVREANGWPVDYVALGPVFATTSKANPDPVIGLEGVRLARSLTSKPLVAIGGITRENCREVVQAGADSVAVISGLMNKSQAELEEFLELGVI